MYVSYARAEYTPGFQESRAEREKQGNVFPFGSSHFLLFPAVSLRFASIFPKNFVDGFAADRKSRPMSHNAKEVGQTKANNSRIIRSGPIREASALVRRLLLVLSAFVDATCQT